MMPLLPIESAGRSDRAGRTSELPEEGRGERSSSSRAVVRWQLRWRRSPSRAWEEAGSDRNGAAVSEFGGFRPPNSGRGMGEWAEEKNGRLESLPSWEPARQKLIYCESGRIGPYFPDFSANRTTMHLQIEKIWPRFPPFSQRSFLPRRLLAPGRRRYTISRRSDFIPVAAGIHPGGGRRGRPARRVHLRALRKPRGNRPREADGGPAYRP